MTAPLQIADPLGVPGAPQETLQAVLAYFGEADLTGGRLILVTDRQGDREGARYAALVMLGREATVTVPAFGPHYGAAGERALGDLTRWAGERSLPVRETVLNPSDFVRVLAEPGAGEVARLIAASSPSDPGIYAVRPGHRRVGDDWETEG
ncbi:DUF3197 domain-containing protein [Deinococcus sp. YIM 134068]|uniref:DUF3197 domain-containing protein n=1 Tax=Deinococcus lichenicola TaxID=3118910 RepID=UPI002F95F8C7